MTSKYHNVLCEADGYTFDSKAELARYRELCLLLAAGDIRQLTVHPTYTLQEAFHDNAGKKWRAITYEGDFSYLEGGREIVEDVKGMRTKEFAIKEKLFRRRYRTVELRLINVRAKRRAV